MTKLAISRTKGHSISQKSLFPVENKLQSVTWEVDGTPCRTEFVYDGDGNRLLKIENMLSPFGAMGTLEMTTLYLGTYERQFNTTDSPIGTPVSGVIPDGVAPIGACLGQSVSPTDYGFTGQRNEGGFGLQDFNERYYSPRLSRFVSPDSIVPDPTSGNGFNRYRYARNSPLVFTDPTGHFEPEAIERYVKAQYGTGWEYYLQLWQSDTEWMALLNSGEAGDIFGYVSEDNNYVSFYQFAGEGEHSLLGVNGLVLNPANEDGIFVSENIDPESLRQSPLSIVGNFVQIDSGGQSKTKTILGNSNPSPYFFTTHTVGDTEAIGKRLLVALGVGGVGFATDKALDKAITSRIPQAAKRNIWVALTITVASFIANEKIGSPPGTRSGDIGIYLNTENESSWGNMFNFKRINTFWYP